MLFCSLLCNYGDHLERGVIQPSDRAATVADMALVLLLGKQNANEFPPQFTFGYKSCFENKRG